jgi:hypothetical protein
MQVSRDGVRREVCIIGVADGVVTPKRGRGVEVLVHTAEQVDVGAVTCATEPGTRCWKGSYRCPGITCRVVLISVYDSFVVYDPAKTIDVATYRSHGVSPDGNRIRSLLSPGSDRSARRRRGVGVAAGYPTKVDGLGPMSFLVAAVKMVVYVVIAIPKTSSAHIAAKRERISPPRPI